MQPTELSTKTFQSLKADYLHGCRMELYESLLMHGPATTRDLAHRTGIGILTVRPRITELVRQRLVVLDGPRGREGVYRAVTESDWRLECTSEAP